MTHSFLFKENKFSIGDTVSFIYSFKEGDKERRQLFKGILLKVKGSTPENKMVTVRKISKSGIGVERIVALISPNLHDFKVVKKSRFLKAKAYFIRNLTEQELRHKLYRGAKK